MQYLELFYSNSTRLKTTHLSLFNEKLLLLSINLISQVDINKCMCIQAKSSSENKRTANIK